MRTKTTQDPALAAALAAGATHRDRLHETLFYRGDVNKHYIAVWAEDHLSDWFIVWGPLPVERTVRL